MAQQSSGGVSGGMPQLDLLQNILQDLTAIPPQRSSRRLGHFYPTTPLTTHYQGHFRSPWHEVLFTPKHELPQAEFTLGWSCPGATTEREQCVAGKWLE